MTPTAAPSVVRLTQLQIQAVARWHEQPPDNPYDGLESLVCREHQYNFRLWHQEDIARSPIASDSQIAEVKKAIDQLNQARNDLIEQIDDALTDQLSQLGVVAGEDAPINTETPGSAIDRLSIMSLRLYHYREQLSRDDIDDSHRQKVKERIEWCQQQHVDLSHSLQQLLDDIFAGRKQHKTYRQLKMYNDSSLNPQIYSSKKGTGQNMPKH